MPCLEKHCSRCGELKPLTGFSRDKQHSTGYKSACKVCASGDFSKWRSSNLETIRKKDRVNHYKRAYNLDQQTAETLVLNRNGVCKICGDISPLVVDHCHTSGDVRGFICGHCNSVLGYAKDNIKTLKSAIKYLEDFYA